MGGFPESLQRNNKKFMTLNCAQISPNSVAGAWDLYQQKDISDETLMSYGYGDGGGGPVKSDIEIEKRLEKGIPGVPKTRLVSLEDAISSIKERVKGKIFLNGLESFTSSSTGERIPPWQEIKEITANVSS